MSGSDTIYILSSSSDEEEDSNFSYCSSKSSKKNTAMKDENKKKFIKKPTVYDEDCIILDYNPFEESVVFPTRLNKVEEDDADISIISEKGQVACRDFPHSRHLCVKFPFHDTPHSTHCEQCYCYVCDCSAPCEFWEEIEGGHCHASDKHTGWNLKRLDARQHV